MYIAGMDVAGGLKPRFVLAWMAGDTRHTVIRDITDVTHPKNVCGIDLLAAGYQKSGPIRFVTVNTISVQTPDLLYVVELTTGLWSPLAVAPPGGQIDDYDVGADGLAAAYVVFTNQGKTAEYHLNARTDPLSNNDRILTTVQSQTGFSASDVHVEFAPSGRSVVFGATGVAGAEKSAPVQVWSLDGRLKFSAAGTNSVTWAGVGDRLFYDDGTNLSQWDEAGTTTLALAGRWTRPSASTDRHYIAYLSLTNSTITVFNTTDLTTKRLPGANTTPVFIAATLLYHRYSLRPLVGLGEARIYDMADSTDIRSPLDHVFGTWPRTTPTYGSD